MFLTLELGHWEFIGHYWGINSRLKHTWRDEIEYFSFKSKL